VRHAALLAPAPRARLIAALESLDLPLIGRLAQAARAGARPAPVQRFETPHVLRPAQLAAEAETARARGTALLRAGRVGFLMVAGGQASRLGYDGPKGAFPIGPVSGHSLFEIFARKLRAAGARYGVPTPWYVMTSPATDGATRAFFAEHDHFGLPRADVCFFQQAMLPALDTQGRILLARADELFLAPNGHGGVLAALADSGALADARARGVEVFSYWQVDNPLAPPADPLFLGLHAQHGAQMSSKVVEKRSADEKVGVLGRADGQLTCIEYSDLPGELREARDASGRLVFGAGNIALHALDLEFVEALTRRGLALPWHLAQKRMRALGPDGALREVEGYKFETFVFDALGLAQASATLEVERAREFSPVKNATGLDSPESARADLVALHSGWVRAAGLALPDVGGGAAVEVDPLLAEDAEELRARAVPPRAVLRTGPRGHWYTP